MHAVRGKEEVKKDRSDGGICRIKVYDAVLEKEVAQDLATKLVGKVEEPEWLDLRTLVRRQHSLAGRRTGHFGREHATSQDIRQDKERRIDIYVLLVCLEEMMKSA